MSDHCVFDQSPSNDIVLPSKEGNIKDATNTIKIEEFKKFNVKYKFVIATSEDVDEVDSFIKEHGLRMSMKCDLIGLMKFLHALGESRRFFGLRGLTIESPGRGKEKLLEVDLECATFEFFEPAESVPQETPVGPGPRGPAPTYGL